MPPGSRRRWLFPFVAIVAALGVAAAATVLALWHRDEAPVRGTAVVREVRPDADTRLEIPGVAVLDVPKGTVSSPVAAQLAPGRDPLGNIGPESRALLHATPPVQVSLSGRQPLKPLTLRLTVPADIDVEQPVLVTHHGGALKTVPGRYDAASRTFSAQLTELSDFSLVDVYQAAVKFMTGVLDVTGVQGRKPGCAGKAAKLADGASVRVANLTGSDTLWPCVSVNGDRVLVDVHSVSGAFWRVTSTGGTYRGAAEVSLRDAAIQALYHQMAVDPRHGAGLIVPQGGGGWEVAAERLPITMTARLSEGMWIAQVTAFTVVWLAEVASGGQAGALFEVAKKLEKALAAGSPLECLAEAAEAAKDGLTLTPQLVVGVSKTALACAKDIFKAVYGAELTGLAALVITVFGSGIATIWGALEVSARNALSRLRPSLKQFGWQIVRASTCPSAADLAKVLADQSPFWHPGDTVSADRIVCAGPYVQAGVVSQGQGYSVLLQRRPAGLTYLKSGSGPICSIFPEDASAGMVVVPQRYGQPLNCIVAR